MTEEQNDQNLFLKKRLNTCRLSTGRLSKIPDDLIINILKSWGRWPGTSKAFYQSIGIKKQQLGSIMKKAKRLIKDGNEKLRPFIPLEVRPASPTTSNQMIPIILRPDKTKSIRFYEVAHLVEFLKKSA